MRPSTTMRLGPVVAVGLLAGLLVGACSGTDRAETAVGASSSQTTSPSRSASPPPSPTPSTSSARARTSWGPSLDDWARAGEIVADMSVPQRAGQVIVATYPGLEPPVGLVSDLELGGVIVMSDNVPSGAGSAAALASVNEQLQMAVDRPYPLVIAVDQEGGPVARVSPPATEFPPGMAHGAANDPALSQRAAQASGSELAALGFTMAYAPVADVTAGPSDPTIGVRSPGDVPSVVSRVVTAQADGLAEMGVTPVLKHFPGHGSVPADSHTELPVQTASLDNLRDNDLVPFAAAIAAGAPAVMVAHIDVRDVDPGVPSSLSRDVVTGLLRDELGFDGVVVTDSLAMAAISDQFGSAESSVAALAAGSDLLLMPPDARAARDGIVAAVQSGRLPVARLDEAARRVVALQLHQRADPPTPALSVVGGSAEVSRDLSAASVTLVSGPCQGRLVGDAVQVLGAGEADRARFTAAAERAGLATGYGDTVVLLGAPGSSGRGDVVVSLDTPHGLTASSAATASLALFGRTPEAFNALVDVLMGQATARGTLPVTVDGVAPPAC